MNIEFRRIVLIYITVTANNMLLKFITNTGSILNYKIKKKVDPVKIMILIEYLFIVIY